MAGLVIPSAPPPPPPLPRLRQDLAVSPGAPSPSGAPAWVIHDPLQHRFIQIDAAARDLLALWPEARDAASLAALMQARTGARITTEEIAAFAHFLHGSDLTVEPARGGWRAYADRVKENTHGWLSQLMHNYLFFRIPLVRPEPFLRATLPLVAPLYTRAAAIVVALLGLVGLYLTSRQWDAFVATFQHGFTLEGAILFAIALFSIKILHELGHAYTAVRHGCRVPTLGLAVMMLAPLLYTDVSGAWALPDRKKRLAIDGAGIVVELAVAALATLLWAFLPDGILRSIAFTLATAGWILSLAINLNPFMRFDGYYLLSEWIGVENLQSRAFALGRWKMREILLGLGAPIPERFPPAQQRFLIAYAWGVWLYRLILFTGIALLVYIFAFKALGIILFLIEIIYFILWPIAAELNHWRRHMPMLLRSPRTAVTAAILCGLIALVVYPWSATVRVPAVLELAETQNVFSKKAAEISRIHVQQGDFVAAGDPLVELTSPELIQAISIAKTKLDLTRLRLARRAADDIDREASLELERERLTLETKLQGLQKERGELTIKAPIGGRVLELNPALQHGRWISAKESLALIGDGPRQTAKGYVREADLWRIGKGTTGRFIPEGVQRGTAALAVSDIAVRGAAAIDVPDLASLHGGEIAVQTAPGNRMAPVIGQYLVWFSVEGESPPAETTVRGVVHLVGARESLLASFWRQALKVLIRESGA